MRLDLHLHSTASDGAWSPAAIADGAAGRLDVIALTDHDTLAGYPEVSASARARRVQVIPAVELSSTHRGRDLHVLGYFVDLSAAGLRAHLESAEGARERRMEAMIDRLRRQGVQVEMPAVIAAAGPERATLGRPHLARALVAAGHAKSVPDAFDRWIGDAHRAFVPVALVDPAAAVALIRGAGGIAVWAHPPLDLLDAVLPDLVRAGLRGIEVYRPRAGQDQVLRLESLARTAGLLVTGGSDWHGPEAGTQLGDFWVSADDVAGFLEEGGL